MTLPHVIPFDPDRVLTDQPWLTLAELELSQAVQDDMDDRLTELHEELNLDSLPPKMRSLLPGHHFILTQDYRIVEEPNFFRFGMFLERGDHRQIDITWINHGREDREHGNCKSPPKHENVYVSTVFVGGSERELFETMIFGGLLNLVKWRSATLIDAKKCHWEVVTVARQLHNHLRRHNRTFRKDWVRMTRFWRLAHKRGQQWALKHGRSMLIPFRRLTGLPGNPTIPMGGDLFELFASWVPRPTLAKDPLL